MRTWNGSMSTRRFLRSASGVDHPDSGRRLEPAGDGIHRWGPSDHRLWSVATCASEIVDKAGGLNVGATYRGGL